MGFSDAYVLLALGALICCGALAARGARGLRLPGLIGYVAVGLVAALFRDAVLTPKTVSTLEIVQQAAGASVLFGIGSKLALPALRERLRSIAWLVGLTLVTSVALGALVFVVSSSGWFGVGDRGLSLGDAAMLGVVLVAASPTVIAFVSREQGADGPYTRMTLAASSLLNALIVLSVVALAALLPTTVGVVLDDVASDTRLALMPAALTFGIAYANLRRPAGAVTGDRSHESAFAHLALSLLFLTAGALTEVRLLPAVLPLALVLVAARAAVMWAGAGAASWLASDDRVRTLGFAAFLPQAGFSLLLIGALGHPSPRWHALLLLVVLVNEMVMPVFLRRALERSGEAQQPLSTRAWSK